MMVCANLYVLYMAVLLRFLSELCLPPYCLDAWAAKSAMQDAMA